MVLLYQLVNKNINQTELDVDIKAERIQLPELRLKSNISIEEALVEKRLVWQTDREIIKID